MGRTAKVASAFEQDQTKTVMPAEQARGVWVHNAPSAQALKVLNLMIDGAGGRMGDDVTHKLKLSDIKRIDGMRNQTQESIKPLLYELHTMIYSFEVGEMGANGKFDEQITNLMDKTTIKYSEEHGGDLTIEWRFTRGFQQMAASSDHWAIIDRQTQFALRSKYSILMFQYLSSLFELKHTNCKTLTLDELRQVLNVPKGTYPSFPIFKRSVLKPMIDEINQLSRYEITIHTIKVGRAVGKVKFSWEEKQDLTPTKRELDSPKSGRKARRNGTAERPVLDNPFPRSGGFPDWDSSVRYWRDEFARLWADYGKGHKPSSEQIADRVRKTASAQNIELEDPKIAKLFENTIKAWR